MSEIATVTRLAPQGMVTLRANFANAAVRKAVKDASGHKLPGQREVAGGLGGGAAWMSPDELMIFCAHDQADAVAAQLSLALAKQHHLAVNVSDARAVFAIEGSPRQVLAKLAPVDMAPGQFEPGQVRRTRLAQVAAAFWLASGTDAHLVCFRSVAEYTEGVLRQAAGASLDLPGWT